ncbi:MAG TPA: ABC transporter permease [Candidatus Polarisedimenticolia bacterium]|nr:ABC transporter permease [Candidatus Polarisedimenticolia bacterium]
MRGLLYLAWRYLAYHRLKSAILIGSIALILYIPIGLRVLVDQSSLQLTARARATPLIVGARGSALELALNTLYFSHDGPERLNYAEAGRVAESGLAMAIPVYVRFRAGGQPIVGTSLDYFEFRGLRIASGRQMATLGECVLGARAAGALGAGPGDAVVSSPESAFDLAGVYPLKMSVAGVLGFADGPDDDAVFVDLKTAWIIEGLGHGHQDLARPEAAGAVLSRRGDSIVANASVVQYNEISADNIDSFHFHGDLADNPLTAVIVVPPDQKSSALLQGRYRSDGERVQMIAPTAVIDELLATILTVRSFVTAGAMILGLATLATTALVFLLSLRLRGRERLTLFKIGGSRGGVMGIMASEIIAVLIFGGLLAAAMTLLTDHFGSQALRAAIRHWG